MKSGIVDRGLMLVALCMLACAGTGCSADGPAPGADAAPPDRQPAAHAPPKQHVNRLAKETSPYLLMHAHNPVDWYPWGDEALAKARRENKPIFLSIGYSSCHWCHVMERESFLDEQIAAFLNQHFVCIKVDREERPDIDTIYMTALQVFYQLSGSGRSGGWPLSMFLTPEAKPFFGGTYFPARDGDRGPSLGLLTILQKVHQAWQNHADLLQRDAETIARHTRRELEGASPAARAPLNDRLVRATLAALEDRYDEQYGGFGYGAPDPQQPKFPEPSNLFFLIDRVKHSADPRARAMLAGTLQRMAMGGIRDHLGGGFHRYSVDRFWRIPHFEKMLYDNAQLASVYTEAYLLTGRDEFRRVVVQTLDFVLREMTDAQGGFYSALDAESDNEEGKYYRWTKQQVQALLEKNDFKLFASLYGLDGPPNFAEHYYVPQLAMPLASAASQRKTSAAQLDRRLAPIRRTLLAARQRRRRPLTDTKILTGWNGLMIRGLADAGRGLKDDRYVKAAENAARFVLEKLRTPDGRLLRTYGRGQAKLNGYLNDYAFLADGLIALYQATGQRQWLVEADQLTSKQIDWFWDDARGGFFFTSGDHPPLLARGKNPVDGALPSGNSVSAQNLVFLAQALDKPDYLERAEATIRSSQELLRRAPAAAPRMTAALAALLKAKAQADANPRP